MNEYTDKIQEIASRWQNKRGSLIMILHDLQEEFGYIERKAALEVARITRIPLAKIYEVVTFYHYFKLSPPAKYVISVCKGTACYLKGACRVAGEIKKILGVEEGVPTPDGLFMLRTVRCLGCCGLAPVVDINGRIFSRVDVKNIRDIIAEYRRKR